MTGETTGSLTLRQGAAGGWGTDVTGNGSSRLHRTGSFKSLALSAYASGGGALDPEVGYSSAAGGSGHAEADAHNDSGDASADTGASGGWGSAGATPGSNGGDAEAFSTASTGGDGHAARAFSSSNGGASYHDLGLPNVINHAGTAHSVSVATALGNGEATADSEAEGGVLWTGSQAFGGGEALAEATASGGGTASVSARAGAIGGVGLVSGASTPLGPAHARALASGLGFVGSNAGAFGDATSTAQSEARSAGSVIASRTSITPLGAQQNPYVLIGADASFRAPSTQARGDAMLSQGYETYTLLNAAPTLSDTVSWVASNPLVSDNVAHASQIHALGRLTAHDGVSGSLSLDFDGAALPDDDLVIGFVNPHAPFGGFDALEVQISFAGSVVWDHSFASASEAQFVLNGTRVTIDAASIPNSVVTLVMSWLFDDGTHHSTFASDFVVFSGSAAVVPEPETIALFAAALALPLILSHRRAR